MKNISAMKNTRSNSAKKESNYKTQKDSTAIYTENGSLTKYGRSLERKAQQANFTAWEGKEVSRSENDHITIQINILNNGSKVQIVRG